MGKLIYSMNVSFDGFVETPDHSLDWATVDDELHTWFNDQARTLDASLYGRRMYELMAGYWPTGDASRVLRRPVRRRTDPGRPVRAPGLRGRVPARHPSGGARVGHWPEVDTPLRLRLVEARTFASGAELRSYAPAA